MTLSHLHPQKPPEKLKEHRDLTEKYFDLIVNSKGLRKVFDRFFDGFGVNREFGFKIVKEAVVLHDEGKVNPNFQYYIMKNDEFKEKATSKSDTNHSMLSAILFFKKYVDKVFKEEDDLEYERKATFLLLMCYLISKHHSKLDDFSEFLDKFKYKLSENLEDFEEYKNIFLVETDFKEEIYIFAKLVFSLIISSDYFATTEYMADIEFDEFSEVDVMSLRDKFDKFYNSLEPKSKINYVRKEIFDEVNRNIKTNENIFYINAPTGAGKTLISLNTALKLNPKKIIYVFPFNTLVEQTKNSLSNAINSDIKVINSITPISEDDEYEDEKAYIDRLMLDYEFVITTHVNFFEMLFGVSKEDNFSLWQLVGSVIIIDEIQSYNINLWQMMAFWFEKYAKFLDMKIIIMSATLPKIDRLLGKNSFYDLLKTNYFSNPLFKDRVKGKYIGEVDFDKLKELIIKENKQKVLVEFIKKDRANEFYEYIKILKIMKFLF